MGMIKCGSLPTFIVLFASFILFGISVTVIGAVLPRALADFSWDYAAAGFVIASGSFGYFLSAYAAGRLVDRLGFRISMAFGLIMSAVGLWIFAATPSVPLNAFLNFGVGFGQGFIEVAVNWSVTRISNKESARPMSVIHGAFSVGAVAGPVAVGAILSAGVAWALVYRATASLFALLLAVSIFIPSRGLDGSKAVQAHHRVSLHSNPAFWLGFLTLFLYVGLEMGLSNWMGEYFVSGLASTAEFGAFAVSAFWGGLLIGRFGLPLIYRGSQRDFVLIGLGIVLTNSTVILAFASWFGSPATLIAFSASIVAGLGCSCIYPISMSLVADAFPDARGEAMGFAAAGGGAGAFLLPFATAFVGKKFGIRIGYAIFIPLAFGVLAVSAFLARVTGKYARE